MGITIYVDASGQVWRVVDGKNITIFAGPDAEIRAKQYSKWLEDCQELLGD